MLILLTSCSLPETPRNVDNICHIFKQYPEWRNDTLNTEKRWGVPVAVQMAIIHQESRFNASAKPPRTKLLWLIPWNRPSTAYGYSQALTTTWSLYKSERGNYFSARDSFADATDFIGWYANQARARAGIQGNDAYALYLAYHEGVTGYMQRTYLKKPWLIAVAHKVLTKSKIYQAQLAYCR